MWCIIYKLLNIYILNKKTPDSTVQPTSIAGTLNQLTRKIFSYFTIKSEFGNVVFNFLNLVRNLILLYQCRIYEHYCYVIIKEKTGSTCTGLPYDLHRSHSLMYGIRRNA